MINKNFIKKFIFVLILSYAIITFFRQQQILNNYSRQSKNLDDQIAIASEKQFRLNEDKKNVNSEKYIEEIAREKLNMYLPNERVYVDKEK